MKLSPRMTLKQICDYAEDNGIPLRRLRTGDVWKTKAEMIAKIESIMTEPRPYYTLLIRQTLADKTRRWCPEFGAYDRAVVEQERRDMLDSSAWADVRTADTMIIRTTDQQTDIDSQVAAITAADAISNHIKNDPDACAAVLFMSQSFAWFFGTVANCKERQAMRLAYAFDNHGGFVAGDLETGRTAYAYPTSNYATRAHGNPQEVARQMMTAENAAGAWRDAEGFRQTDRARINVHLAQAAA